MREIGCCQLPVYIPLWEFADFLCQHLQRWSMDTETKVLLINCVPQTTVLGIIIKRHYALKSS